MEIPFGEKLVPRLNKVFGAEEFRYNNLDQLKNFEFKIITISQTKARILSMSISIGL
jgi:hypothetical protein